MSPMTLLDIEFEWSKDPVGYKLVAERPGDTDPHATMLARIGYPQYAVPISGKSVPYKLTRRHSEHYVEFAQVRTPDDVVKFCSIHGSLTRRGMHESVPDVLTYAKILRDWMNAAKGRRKQLAALIGRGSHDLVRMMASLSIDASGNPRLQISPSSLLGLIYLQFVQAMTGENATRECPQCGDWFKTGPGTNRRLDAKYCSPEHQRLFNSLRRDGAAGKSLTKGTGSKRRVLAAASTKRRSRGTL
jgi:hypothetical protein